jgi:hypothetical protein
MSFLGSIFSTKKKNKKDKTFDVSSFCKGRNAGRREMRNNASEAARTLARIRWDKKKS